MQRWSICIGVGVLALIGTSTAEDPGARAQAAAFVNLLADASLRPVAERALESMGDDAIPALAAALADVQSPVRTECAVLLGRLGAKSDAAKQALTGSVDERDAAVRVAACTALLEIGESGDAVVAGLASALASPSDAVRRAAAAGLKKAGKDSKSAIPALVAALDDRDDEVRKQASATLSSLGVVALAALDGGTRSDSRIQRASAVRALASLGADAHPAVTRLTDLLKDDSDMVRAEAAIALGRIGQPAHASAAELLRVLNAESSRVDLRQAALIALDKIAPRGWSTVDTLLGLWKHEDARMRAFAARELGSRKAEKALPDLVLGLNDMSHLVRTESALALAHMAPGDEVVLGLLTAAVRDRLLLAPREAARALGEMGAQAAPAKIALQEAMLSEEPDLAQAAEDALQKIG
ncbi:MAG: HEAT repeat domain-containing protein [Deltaproteobacteria bacterium]|nr:HEAT repeat domain-containing protein [Deltaproteobacteria bacterium]